MFFKFVENRSLTIFVVMQNSALAGRMVCELSWSSSKQLIPR